jgi:hypothetical protein
MINMEDSFLTKDVVSPLLECLDQPIKFLVISVVVDFGFGQALKMVGYWMSYLLKNSPCAILGSTRCQSQKAVAYLTEQAPRKSKEHP